MFVLFVEFVSSMSHYCTSAIIVTILVIASTHAWTPSASVRQRSSSIKNGSVLNVRHRAAAQASRIRNMTASVRDRLHLSHEHPNGDDDDEEEEDDSHDASRSEQKASVVVLTSLSGIYVWWPTLFGGDDSFHLLLTQEDVPRFHDVAGDDHGNIYLTAPHERTVYRLKFADGWWISNFSNHSVMNSIRSEMPLFLNVHYVSSVLYVYGHSDIQIIDLLERPYSRGSAPFMKRLRELSPSLRISDMIIDQLTSDGYIIGDSYGWCTVIRCALGVSECVFLFKIPSSYDNRPYPCTATIDFSTKIMFLSLEEKIIGVYLNEQTNYDRRYVLTEKRGPRSTLGYDDIATYNQAVLYTDVLRPLLHLCTITNSNPCLNISLAFPPPQRSILPLRLSIVQVPYLRPPELEADDEFDLHIGQTTTVVPPPGQLVSNTTTDAQRLMDGTARAGSRADKGSSNIWMLVLGVSIGLLLAGLSLMIYYVLCNKNRPKLKKERPSSNSNLSATKRTGRGQNPLLGKITDDEDEEEEDDDDDDDDHDYQSASVDPRKRSAMNKLILPSKLQSSESNTGSSSDFTTVTTSSSSYRPDTVL